MMDIQEIIDSVLSLLKRKSLDAYEIYLNQSSHFDIESKDGKIETLQTSRYLGMAFRIISHQRMGFSYMTLSSPSSTSRPHSSTEWNRMIEDAIGSARATAEDPCFDFAPPLNNLPPPLPIFDESLEKISEKAKVEKAMGLEESARSVDSERIKKVRKAAYQEILSKTTLVNSKGFQLTYDQTLTSINVTAVAEASGESEVGWDFDVSHFFGDLEVEKVGRSAAQRALESLGGKRIPTGVYPVLIRNHIVAEFLSVLAHSFLGDQVQKGKSHLKGRKGEKFFSPLVTMIDDGLHPKGTSTAPVDGEGTPSQRTCLVDRGVIGSYLYDRYWANRESRSSIGQRVESTGNSRRQGIKSPPGIGISNFFIQARDLSFGKLMENLFRGVVVEEVMGLHTIDPISGDFSLGCSGSWIEKGEKVHPVKSVAIAGNLFELFRKVIGVGDDLRFLGGVGAPSLIVKDVFISGI